MKKLLSILGVLSLFSLWVFAQDSTGAHVSELTFNTPVDEIAFLSDTQLAVAQSQSASIAVYDITSGGVVSNLTLDGVGQVQNMVVSLDGAYIAINLDTISDGAQGGTYVYTTAGAFITRIPMNSDHMQFLDDGILFLLSPENVSLFYDVTALTPVTDGTFPTYDGEVTEMAGAIAWNARGSEYVPVGVGSIYTVGVKNEDRRPITDLFGAVFSPNRSHIGYVFTDGNAAIFDVESDIFVTRTSLGNAPMDIAYAPDNSYLAVSTESDVNLLSFDRVRSTAISAQNDGTIPHIAFSPDSSLLAVVTDTGIVIHNVADIGVATEALPTQLYVAPTSSIMIPTVPPTRTPDSTVAEPTEATAEVTSEVTDEVMPTEPVAEVTEDVEPTEPVAEVTEDVEPTEPDAEVTEDATSSNVVPTANVIVPTVALPTATPTQ